MAIQEAVRKLRKHMRMRQDEFAAALGVSVRTVSNYELYSPPKGPMLWELHRLAVNHQLQEEAIVFWNAAAVELGMKDGVLEAAKAAWNRLPAVLNACATIDSRTEDAEVRKAVDDIRAITETVESVLEMVLPMRAVRQERGDGTIEAGVTVDRSKLPAKKARP